MKVNQRCERTFNTFDFSLFIHKNETPTQFNHWQIIHTHSAPTLGPAVVIFLLLFYVNSYGIYTTPPSRDETSLAMTLHDGRFGDFSIIFFLWKKNIQFAACRRTKMCNKFLMCFRCCYFVFVPFLFHLLPVHRRAIWYEFVKKCFSTRIASNLQQSKTVEHVKDSERCQSIHFFVISFVVVGCLQSCAA